MKVAVIRYNAGNLQSIVFALRRLGVEPAVTDGASELLSAARVIFPGVGHAGAAMSFLRRAGLDRVIRSITAPVLGICLGLQLLCDSSEEGDVPCLGILKERARRLPAECGKVPHVGWNTIEALRGPLFQNVPEGSFVYFVHSYAVPCGEYTTARCEYGEPFCAAAETRNFFGLQFHPERSGAVGARILRNFLELQL